MDMTEAARAESPSVREAIPQAESSIRARSEDRDEPSWLVEFRLASLEALRGRWNRPWSLLSGSIDLDRFFEYRRPEPRVSPGSEAPYGPIRDELGRQGVLLMGLDRAVHKVPGMVREVLGSAVSSEDGPSAAFNGATWSGGSFLYVPRGVHVRMPLQPEFREDFHRTEPIERTLIVVDEAASVDFIDGCAAPMFAPSGLHASVAEIVVRKGGHIGYVTLQNWSKDVHSLVTKRARIHEGASMEWLEANLGSRKTVKAPSVQLAGSGARAEIRNLVLAGPGQHQAIGAEADHLAPDTSSRLEARVLLRGNGRVTYEPRVLVTKEARGARSVSEWTALALDEGTHWEATPSLVVEQREAWASQSGSMERFAEDIAIDSSPGRRSAREAVRRKARTLFEPFLRRIPEEYAVEVERLVGLELDGAVG